MREKVIGKIKNLLNFDSILLKSIIFYILLAIILLPFYRYQINTDGVSYMSIAQKYINRDFSNAINGYWGPLLSWLLIPFLLTGLKPLLAAKFLTLTVGVVAILISNSILKILQFHKSIGIIALILITIIILSIALTVISPDILFLCFSLAYIKSVIDSKYLTNQYAGLVSGLMGSGIYLAKSYGLPFFLASFFIINLIFFLRNKSGTIQMRSIIIRNFITGLAVFCLISGSWIFMISNKYGYFTIGTAGRYNHEVYGPNSLGHPVMYMGILDPPNKTAISNWEDASYLKMKEWSLFDSIDTFFYQIKLFKNNLLHAFEILTEFSYLSFGILLIAFCYLFEKGKRFIFENIFILIVLITILFSGYLMLLVVDRYVYLGNILIIIIGAKLMELLFVKVTLSKVTRFFLVFVFMLSFLKYPVKSLQTDYNSGKELSIISDQLKKTGIEGRIASTPGWESWNNSLNLSFLNNWKYYGACKLDNPETEKEFKRKSIDYYIDWRPFDNTNDYLKKFEEISQDRIKQMKIYKLD